jgi:hypothetical protein
MLSLQGSQGSLGGAAQQLFANLANSLTQGSQPAANTGVSLSFSAPWCHS